VTPTFTKILQMLLPVGRKLNNCKTGVAHSNYHLANVYRVCYSHDVTSWVGVSLPLGCLYTDCVSKTIDIRLLVITWDRLILILFADVSVLWLTVGVPRHSYSPPPAPLHAPVGRPVYSSTPTSPSLCR